MKPSGLLLPLGCALTLFVSGADAGVVGLWSFEDNLNDTAGATSENGTAVGGPTYSTDVAAVAGGSKSLYLDGDDAVEISGITGTEIKFSSSDDFTLEMYAKFAALPGTDHFMAVFYEDWAGSWLQLEDASGSTQVVSRLSGAAAATGYTPTGGEWHHYAVVYSGSGATDTVSVYVDHVLVGTANGSYSLNGGKYIIGKNHGSPPSWQEWINGYVDEVRISDEALNTSQMMAAVPEPSTVGLFAAGMTLLLTAKRRK